MADWVRDKALMSMTSPLPGQDTLIPVKLLAEEQMSGTFEFDIDAVSQTGAIDPDKLLNQPVCVTVRDEAGPIRYFHGIVQEVKGLGTVRGKTASDEFFKYHLHVVPRLWFLHQTHDHRLYLNKSTKDILTSLFNDAKLTDFTFAVSASASRPYTTQYDESDYDFAKRLMEGDGWFYFFEHTDSKHNLVITDSNTTFKAIANATLHFAPDDVEAGGGMTAWDSGGVTKWDTTWSTATGAVKMKDYDPDNPGTQLQKEQKTVLKTTGSEARDVFRWPAGTNSASVVENRARFELEAVERVVAQRGGNSHFAALVPGGKFTLANTPAAADDAVYYLVYVGHSIIDDSWMASDGTVAYKNDFAAVNVAVPYRDRPYAPRPVATGIHTGLVLGPQHDVGTDVKMQDGEEIFTDDQARVKVRFFWDHRAEATGSATAWARVVQPWAGNGWGAQFLPRVGTEVAVAFIDGDPDRPVVVGGLYNGDASPIFSKADKTKSGFRSRSSMKGSTSKFSELTFDDKSGNELIFIHAEKDLTTEVENNETLTVSNCRVVTVDSDETITIKGKQTTTITGDHSLEIKQGNHNVKVDMGNQSTEVSMGNYDLKLPMGNVTVKTDLGKISMEAMQSITLTVGQNSLTIDQTGVKISGMMLSFAGQVSTEVKGLMTKVGGDVMLTLKGAITMIN